MHIDFKKLIDDLLMFTDTFIFYSSCFDSFEKYMYIHR